VVTPSYTQLQTIQRISGCMVGILALFLPFGIWAVLDLPMGSAGVHEWLPEGRPERARYEHFTERFGNDQVLLVSWDECRLDDARLPLFVQRVRSQPNFDHLVDSLESTDELVRQLTGTPLSLSLEQVEERLRGVMLGENGTCLVVAHISHAGVAEQNDTIELFLKSADETDGLSRSELRLAGTVFEAYAVDHAAEASLKRLVLPSSLLGLSVCWFCLRRLRRTIVVLAVAGIGQLIAIAMVYYSGYRFSAVLIVLPTLVFMLTLSGAVHLMNYYMDCQRREPGKYAGAKGMLIGWKPCALSSITTMLGMGSLVLSQLAPVRQFGVFSAVGLGIATVLLLLSFPVLADWFGGESNRTASLKPERLSESRTSRAMLVYLRWLDRNAMLVSYSGIGLLILTCAGLVYLKASTKFSDMFPLESKTNVDMDWMERNIGPIATVEVLLRFPKGVTPNELDRASLVSKVSSHLRSQSMVGGAMSAVVFLPHWSDSSSVRATSKRALLRKGIEEALPDLQSKGLLVHSEGEQIWRLIVKVSATSEMDYGSLTRAVSSATHDALTSLDADKRVTAEFTGLAPVMHETQLALLSDLGYSFLSAFVLITPVMMMIARSISGGLLLMLPNVLPVSIAFGCMGWFGFDLDIAGILTASIALGIAVDDTLHFVCWYMEELRQGHSRPDAVVRTFRSCSAAMVHTTLISCLSMAPFLFAEFVPTQQFAKLMIVMLSGAIVGDLFLLPALLMSPLGKMIDKPSARRCTS
jgi:uncharacterized protein